MKSFVYINDFRKYWRGKILYLKLEDTSINESVPPSVENNQVIMWNNNVLIKISYILNTIVSSSSTIFCFWDFFLTVMKSKLLYISNRARMFWFDLKQGFD